MFHIWYISYVSYALFFVVIPMADCCHIVLQKWLVVGSNWHIFMIHEPQLKSNLMNRHISSNRRFLPDDLSSILPNNANIQCISQTNKEWRSSKSVTAIQAHAKKINNDDITLWRSDIILIRRRRFYYIAHCTPIVSEQCSENNFPALLKVNCNKHKCGIPHTISTISSCRMNTPGEFKRIVIGQ